MSNSTSPTLSSDGDYASRSSRVFAVTIAVWVCSTTFVLFRFVSRAGIVKKLGLDDLFIAIAWLLAFGMSFAICYGTFVGLGRHESDVPDKWQGALKKSQYAFSVLYNPALMAEKTSILAFYLTLSKTNRTFRWATIATLFVVNAAGLALTIVSILQCAPVSAAFDFPTPMNYHCTDIVTIYLSSAPANIITDVAILFLPMPILTSMRLPKKQKAILVITFGFGIFVAVVDIVRIAYLQSASTYRLNQIIHDLSTTGRDTDATDFSWYASYSFMWSAIEVNVGIMCACVPALKPLVSRFLPHLLRDIGDVTEKHSSVNGGGTFQMAVAHRVPSMPESAWVHMEAAPSSSEPAEDMPDSDMNMMDFLTSPDMNELPNELQRTQTALTNTSRATRADTPTFFDFVNMKRKKSFVQMTTRESIFPISMVTILFFVWGFEYGLLDVLNKQFQTVTNTTPAQSVGIHSAYYAGYFLGPITFGRLLLKKYGFKACYTVGLAIYACGTLIFWPAAVLTSFPTFVIVNVLVGLGLSTLEIAANPFIALCGPAEYSEVRLNLSQGFQAIGTVVAPLIARKALFNYTDAPSLLHTQWAYLGIAMFTFLLAAAFFYVPLPEGTDAELEERSERLDHANMAKIGNVRIVWYILGFGVLAMFCYVGGQETIATDAYTYMGAINVSSDLIDNVAIAHAVFAFARFVAAGLGWIGIQPRVLLMFFFSGAIIFSVLAMNYEGKTGLALWIVVFFFEGPLFSLIFAQSIRGMGRYTRDASAFLTSAISGGAFFPAIAYVVRQSHGIRYSFCVAVAAFAFGSVFPIVLNLFGPARRVVDPIVDIGKAEDDEQDHADSPASSIANRAMSLFSFANVKRKRSHDGIHTEWREREGSGDTTNAADSRKAAQ